MDISAQHIEPIIDAIATRGWCVTPGFLSEDSLAALRATCMARHAAGAFHQAGVGARAARVVAEVRGDAILWLDENDTEAAPRAYLAAMESLRQEVNRALFLGLDQLEAHFAVYPLGGFYKKHLDRFRDDDRRALTAIVYLNDAWTTECGGLLRFWTDPSGEGEVLDIPPQGGTLVTFLSDRFWHEVLPARRQRLAVTGWFKRR